MMAAVRRSAVIVGTIIVVMLTFAGYGASAAINPTSYQTGTAGAHVKPNGARPPASFHSHSHVHRMPIFGERSPDTAVSANFTGDGSNLSYQGGQVLAKPKVYVVFWVPSGQTVGGSYKNLLPRFIRDVGRTGLAGVLRQYPSLSGPPQSGVTFGGAWTDTTAYPSGRGSASNPLLDSDIQNEMYYAAGQNSTWTQPGHSAIYVVATARGVDSCMDSSETSCSFAGVGAGGANYCGYHSVTADGAGGVYVNLPDSNNRASTGCGFANYGLTAPNNGEADWAIKVFSHELFETMTNPDVNTSATSSWTDDEGFEIGDKCNDDFPDVSNNANLVVGTHRYLVQSEWSNAIADCTMNYQAATDPHAVRNGFNQNILASNDDGSAPAVNMGFSATLGSSSYSKVYPNNNGNLTFDGPDGTFTPHPLSDDSSPRLAGFFADVDTRAAGTTSVAYGRGRVGGHPAFGVTWSEVGYYSYATDKLNRFQIIIINRSDIAPGDVDVEFNYDQILWETGGASGGVQGLGGVPAVVGISLGASGGAEEFPGSGQSDALEDWGTNPLVAGGATPGRWLTEIRGGTFFV